MSASRYAEGTDVPVERSKAEIEAVLRKHGAQQFGSAWDDESAESLMFCRIAGRMIRFRVQQPRWQDFVLTPKRVRRKEHEARAAAEKEHMRRWRARLLVTKAKLEIIATGESTIEREFLADIVLPGNATVGEWLAPQLEEAYTTGAAPRSIPMLGPGRG